MSRVEHGRVEIPFVDKTVTIQPTIEAMLAVNRRFGDLSAALERVRVTDFEAIAFILGAGCGREDINQAVFEAGVGNMAVPAAQYLGALANPSGRKPGESAEGKA